MVDDAVQELFERYFEGDLDRIEAQEFEERLTNDPAVQAAFDRAWDERTDAHGLFALEAPEPVMAHCFSDETLRRYSEQELRVEHAELVRKHLDCLYCRMRLPRADNPKAVENGVLTSTATIVAGALHPANDPEPAPSLEPAATTELISLRATPAPQSRWWGPRTWLPGALAASVVLFVAVHLAPGSSQEPDSPLSVGKGMDHGFEPPGKVTMRSGPGGVRSRHEVLRLRTSDVEAGHYGCLRIYLAGVGVMVECPGDPICKEADGGGYTIEYLMESMGRWTAAWFVTASGPLPPTKDGLEADLQHLDALDVDYEIELKSWEVQ